MNTNANNQLRLKFSVFGPFAAFVGGMPLKPNRPGDLPPLAFLLVHHDSQIDRALIAQNCWISHNSFGISDQLEKLAKSVYELSKRLNSKENQYILKPTPQTLLFSTHGVDLDLLDWESALASGNPLEMKRVAPLLFERGLLIGWDHEWVIQVRKRLRDDFFSNLASISNRADALADWKQLEVCLELHHCLDPENTSVIIQYMKLLSSRRKYIRTQEVFETYVNRLTSVGKPVDSSVRDVFRTLQEEARSLELSQSNGYLPIPLSSFVGRLESVEEVERLVLNTRLTTLTGSGGVGKTRLALEVARRLKEEFYDRVWFIDLSEIISADGLTVHVCQRLNMTVSAGIPSIASLRNALAGWEALIILDNCEHILDQSATFCAEILQDCSSIKILTTSREPLDLFGEAVWRVPSLFVPQEEHRLSLDEILGLPAVRLLEDRASRTQCRFNVTADSAADALRLCRRLDGIPLAIELASVQINRRFKSLKEVADNLEHSFDSLCEGSRAALSRHQTIEAVILWGYDLLPPIEKTVLEQVSIFSAGFTEAGARQVCRDVDDSDHHVVDAVISLHSKSMLEVREGISGARYYLLQTIREFASIKFAQSIETYGTLARHFDYCLELLVDQAHRFGSAEQAAAFDIVTDEHSNILAALSWAFDNHKLLEGLKLAGLMGWFWHTHDYYQTGLGWLKKFINSAPPEMSSDRLKALLWAGNLMYTVGAFTEAKTAFEEAVVIRERIGSELSIASGKQSLANVIGALGDHHESIKLSEANLEVFRAANDGRNTAHCLVNIAIQNYHLTQYDKCIARYTEALSLMLEMGDVENSANIKANLIGVHRSAGDLASASLIVPEALDLCRRSKSSRLVANCVANAVGVLVDKKEFQRAAILHGFERALRRRIQYPVPDAYRTRYDRDVAHIRSSLSDDDFIALALQGERCRESEIVTLVDVEFVG